jgi:hypothetical protein
MLVILGVSAQSIDVGKLDLTKAKMTVAGPFSIYVRSISYMGAEISVLLKYDGAIGATVYGPWTAAQKGIQDWMDLSYVRMEKFGTDTVAVYDVLMGGMAYSGRLKYDGGVKVVLDSYWKTTPPKTFPQQVAELKSEVQKQKDLVSSYKRWAAGLSTELETTKTALRTAKSDLNKAAKGEPIIREVIREVVKEVPVIKEVVREVPAATAAVAKPSRTIVSGVTPAIMKMGQAVYGTWNLALAGATQSNATLKYAKFPVPLSQTSSQTLYGFAAKAAGSGWVGYGAHFFASGSKRSNGYGFGQSYLVWLTRDEGYYKSASTYLQLYRSYDDVTMVQIGSVAIPESISNELNTEVIYDRTKRTISVFVNGVKRLEQVVEDPIWSGDTVALRTLGGGVTFTRGYIKVK